MVAGLAQQFPTNFSLKRLTSLIMDLQNVLLSFKAQAQVWIVGDEKWLNFFLGTGHDRYINETQLWQELIKEVLR
jgi:hypothetical protein